MDIGIKNIINDDKRSPDRNCIVCGKTISGRVVCYECGCMTKDYDKLMNYVNSRERVDNDLLYLLEFAKGDRMALIINNVDLTSSLVADSNGEFCGVNVSITPKNYTSYINKKVKEISELKEGVKIIKKIIKEQQIKML